jgi:hypothetical protein
MEYEMSSPSTIISPPFFTVSEASFFREVGKMPFVFESKYFLDYITEKQKVIENLDLPKKASMCLQFSIPNKISHHRRMIQIPNPLYYAKASFLVSQLFETEKHLRVNPKTLNLKWDDTKNGFVSNGFDSISIAKYKISVGHSRYLELDISQFYPSIYTHSIPWVVLGKEEAKIEYKKEEKDWSPVFKRCNDIDTILRKMNADQTKGIPIGPLLFSCIALLVSRKINIELEKFIKDNDLDVDYRHYVDDYYIFCDSEKNAKTLLSQFTMILHKYELQINSKKIKNQYIETVHFQPYWKQICSDSLQKIREKPSRDSIVLALESIRRLRNKDYRGENQLNYVLKSLMKILKASTKDFEPKKNHIKPVDIEEIIIPFILNAFYLEPCTLQNLFDTDVFDEVKPFFIENFNFKCLLISKIIPTCVEHHYTDELMWCLHGIRQFDWQGSLTNECEIWKSLKKYDNPLIKIFIMEIEHDINTQRENDSLFSQEESKLTDPKDLFYSDEWILYFYLIEKIGWDKSYRIGVSLIDDFTKKGTKKGIVDKHTFFNFSKKPFTKKENQYDPEDIPEEYAW